MSKGWISRNQDRMLQHPVLPLGPFEKWGMDFMGPFKPVAELSRNRYIFIATDYCTKWVEAVALKDNKYLFTFYTKM